MLLTYAQSPEATIDRILSALHRMQRLDIINQIKDYVNNLVAIASQDVINRDGKVKSNNIFFLILKNIKKF